MISVINAVRRRASKRRLKRDGNGRFENPESQAGGVVSLKSAGLPDRDPNDRSSSLEW